MGVGRSLRDDWGGSEGVSPSCFDLALSAIIRGMRMKPFASLAHTHSSSSSSFRVWIGRRDSPICPFFSSSISSYFNPYALATASVYYARRMGDEGEEDDDDVC